MLTRIFDRLGFIPKHQRMSLEEQIESKVEYISTLIERNEVLKEKLADVREKIGEKQGIIDKLNNDKQAVIDKLNSGEVHERNELLKTKLTEARDKIGEKQSIIDRLNSEKQALIDKQRLEKLNASPTDATTERVEFLKTKLDEARSKVAEKQKTVDALNERLVALKEKLK